MKKGYFTVKLDDKVYYLHVLLARNFIKNENNFKLCRHINNHTLDNRLENLEWFSPEKIVKEKNYKNIKFD